MMGIENIFRQGPVDPIRTHELSGFTMKLGVPQWPGKGNWLKSFINSKNRNFITVLSMCNLRFSKH